jgi:hypothetical protein
VYKNRSSFVLTLDSLRILFSSCGGRVYEVRRRPLFSLNYKYLNPGVRPAAAAKI